MTSPAPGTAGPPSADGPTPVRTLARLARLLDRACDDPTLPQYRLLAMIDAGGARASLLAERLAVSKPSISSMVDALADRGLVDRREVRDDRRAVHLGLTPAGRRALRQAERRMEARLDEVLAHCVDRPAVERALSLLGDALDAARRERHAGAATSASGPAPGPPPADERPGLPS